MSPIREVVTQWRFKGERLARPDMIVRRLIALPFLRFAESLVVVFVALGWGVDEACDVWRELP